jgi:hypothetical protein
MKRLFIIFILFTLTSICAQNNQLDLIQDLSDPDPNVRARATYTIVKNNLVEYIPYIENLIFGQSEPFMIFDYLEALNKLHSPNIVSITMQYIDLADSFESMFPKDDPLSMKLQATMILFANQNYSTVDYVFQIIERDRPKVDFGALHSLDFIIRNIPDYAVQAKKELIYISNNCPDEYGRYLALLYLNNNYHNEELQQYVDKFTNDLDFTVRLLALEYLFTSEYYDLENLLLQRISLDSYPSVRRAIVDSLLTVFGKPTDLKTVIEYQPTEPDETAKSLMGYAIQEFIPPRPTEATAVMIDNLISYTDELYQYGWVTTQERYDTYKNLLNGIKKAYNRGSLDNLCTNLNQLLWISEQDYQSSAITQEGYKFLHYHGIYIKENVESELGTCQ